MVPFVDRPDRFRVGAAFQTDEADPRSLTVESVKPHHKGGFILGFEEVDGRDEAEALRGRELSIPLEERRGLEEDEFWPSDLEGLQVRTASETIGVVVDVVLGEAQDRLVVELAHGGRVEIPFVDELVSEVDPAAGFLVIRPIEGLLG